MNTENNNTPTRTGLFYATTIIAALNAILPFCKWVKIPMLNTLSSWFGGSSNSASYSLFGYIFSAGSIGNDEIVGLVIGILALLSLISIIFNIIFVIKAFKNKAKYYKYGTIASIIMLIMSILFIIIVGLMSAILQVIKMTFVSWLAFALSIANIILIKKLKRENSKIN